jgi:hypothetical protein
MLSAIDRSSIIRGAAIFMMVAGALLLIGGVFLLIFALLPKVMTSATADGSQSITISAANPVAVILEAIVILIEGGALIFVSRRLSKRHPTARMATVIVTGVSAIIGLVTFLGGAATWGGLMLILSGIVCYLFYFDAGIKQELSVAPPVSEEVPTPDQSAGA